MARKRKVNFSKFQIPDSLMETFYELTGSLNSNKGYILVYIDEEGCGEVKSRFDTQATEFALLRFLEVYLQNKANVNSIETDTLTS